MTWGRQGQCGDHGDKTWGGDHGDHSHGDLLGAMGMMWGQWG